MGVNLLEDASNDSTASSSSTGAGHNNLAKNTNINLVLKDRDTNIRNGVCGSTQLDITFRYVFLTVDTQNLEFAYYFLFFWLGV